MTVKLLRLLIINFLFTALFSGVASQRGFAQTNLTPGDLAIITVNADDNKHFDFVPLVDIKQDTEIKFTDNAYDAATDSLYDNEGTLTYIASEEISAGTPITMEISGGFNPSASGDNIIAYQGTKEDPTYIYGIGWARGGSWDQGSIGTTYSDIPPGLSKENNTIVNLGTTDNYQYAGELKGTAKSLLSAIAQEENWNENDNSSYGVFDDSFTLINPPTIAFATQHDTIKEDQDVIELPVVLMEAADGDKPIDAEISFVESAGTVSSGDDIIFESPETISFLESDTSGTVQYVTVTLIDDSEFEGQEAAVFQLQNISDGTILSPGNITISIRDNDAPQVIINELMPDPSGEDLDGNSSVDGRSDDEFIELVNNEDEDVDISGWTVSDNGENIVYTFPKGTVIPASGVLLLFSQDESDDYPKGNFGGAIVHISDKTLALNNTGDTPTLRNADGLIVDQVSYSSSSSGISLNRNPDITGSADSFVDHTEVATNGEPFSPGLQADGTAFGAGFAAGIRGEAGWRMISSPADGVTFEELLSEVWTQGMTGADSPDGAGNVLYWDPQDDSLKVISSLTENLEPGRGYAVYFFEDDDGRSSSPGIQGGFPKVIRTEKQENDSPVSVTVSAEDSDGDGLLSGNEGWNLLGNPFGTDISVDGVLEAVRTALQNHNSSFDVNGNVYIWNHRKNNGNGGYEVLAEASGNSIAPFQAFWVRVDTVETTENFSVQALLNRDDLAVNKGTALYKQREEAVSYFELELHDGERLDDYRIEFSKRSKMGKDRRDAYKLFSLNYDALSVYGVNDGEYYQKNSFPDDLEEEVEIPIGFDASSTSNMLFRWNNIDDLPRDWDIYLVDYLRNREINLRTEKEYQFTSDEETQGKISEGKELLNKTSNGNNNRFGLIIQPSGIGSDSQELSESMKLYPNYPNPFSNSTILEYKIPEDAEVTLTIWNMIGQKVATLVDQFVNAGEHSETWNASNMPSGMYIARFEVNGEVFTRKMTLIK